MIRRAAVLTAALVAVALTALQPQSAEAKTPGHIITGGELGSYAAFIDDLTIGDEEVTLIQLPAPDSTWLKSPPEHLGPAYEMFLQMGYLGLLPLLEFYPEAGVMRLERWGDWFEPGARTLAFLDGAVEYALTKKADGLLEEGTRAAQARAKRLPQSTFVLHPYAVPGEVYGLGTEPCARCVTFTGLDNGFVMDHLVEVLSGPPIGPAAEMPLYAIRFQTPDGLQAQGLLGMYRPPEGDRPGQFWAEHYSRDALYYETTPGFDAVLAPVIRDVPEQTSSPASQISTDSGEDSSIWLWLSAGAVASALALVLAFGGVRRVLARRRA